MNTYKRQFIEESAKHNPTYEVPQMNKMCNLCSQLIQSRKRITWGYGSPYSKVMFVGEAPGYAGCDITGIPFTRDRSGLFFQKMLAEIGCTKDDVYVTNIVKCCPPANRAPTSEEVDNCIKYLKYEIAHIKPSIVVLMGKAAIQPFFPLFKSVTALWNRCVEDTQYYNCTFFFIPHPAYVLRNMKDLEHLYIKSFKLIQKMIEEEERWSA